MDGNWTYTITGQDGVFLTDDDPQTQDYEEHLLSLERFSLAFYLDAA